MIDGTSYPPLSNSNDLGMYGLTIGIPNDLLVISGCKFIQFSWILNMSLLNGSDRYLVRQLGSANQLVACLALQYG